MNDRERYLFDIQGYLVVENVLNAEQLARLNQAIDEQYPEGTPERIHDFFAWEEPVFRDLIVDSVIEPYLTAILGPYYRLDHEYGICHRKGAPPLHLHGGGTPYDVGQYYHVYQNRIYSGLTVVSYALTDIGEDDGGFCCIPGSHKANFRCPPEFIHFDDYSPIVHVPQKAGSVLIFTEALTHGTLAWQGSKERRSLLYKYAPAQISWAPYDRSPEMLEKLTPQQRDILDMPASDYVMKQRRAARQARD